MKKNNKLLTIIVSIIAILSLVLPMNAIAADENAELVINSPVEYTLTASDYTAYKLFDATVSGSDYSYTAVGAIEEFENVYPALAPLNDTLEDDDVDMDAVNKALTAFAGTGGFDATKVTAVQNGTNSVKFTGLDYGYYLVVGQTELDGEKVINYSNILTVDQDTVPVNVKADLPPIEKYVSDEEEPDIWGKDTDVNIGDTVYFKITSTVPDMRGYIKYTFRAHDILQNYFTLADNFGKDDVRITIGGVPYTTHTVTVVDEADGHKITIDFGANFIKQTKGQDIVITYSAMLNETAQIAEDGNDNDVRLEYSNDPYTDTTNKTPYKKVRVYTFKLDLKKVDGVTEEALTGAGFTLRNSKDPDTNIQFIDLSDGKYRVAKKSEIAANPATLTDTLMVDETNAKLNVKGLDAGTYTLEETVVPDGYNKMPDKIIAITRIGTTGAYTVKVDDEDATNGTTCEIVVENHAGSEFPRTGGVGTTIFYASGSLLAVGIILFLIIRRRRNILKAK